MSNDLPISEYREALSVFSKEDLIDMLVQVVRAYVLEGTQPYKPELSPMNFPRHLRELTFPQLIEQLQLHLDYPELGLFQVSGNDVFVTIGGRQFMINPYNDDVAGPSGESASHRAQEALSERPTSGGPAPAGTPQPKPAPRPAAPAAKPKRNEPFGSRNEGTDRFSMLDLD